MIRSRVHGDRGATLILVLVFVMSFALIVPALLSATQSSVLIVSSARDISQRTGDAAGAGETAVNLLRKGGYDNAPGQPCFHDPADLVGGTDSSVLRVKAPNGGGDALVTCQPDPLTGYPTSVRQTVPTPATALLAFPSGGEAGVRQNGNNVLRVAGEVYSNGGITVPNNNAALVDTNAGIYAKGACSGDVQAPIGGVNCGQAGSTDARYLDPNYELPGAPPAPAPNPSCTGATKYVLTPGTYKSAAALSALNQTSCGSPLVLLDGTVGDGIFYFDFQDAGSHVWDVAAGKLIGGKPRGWSYSTYPSPAPVVPGACVDPSAAVGPNGGVTLIFGGDSRLSVSSAAQVEFCGKYDSARPPIAIFGANAGNGVTTTSVTVKTNATNANGSPDFANQVNIRDSDSAFSTATPGKQSQADTKTVTISLPHTAPSGAVLTSATLRVRHADESGPVKGSGSNTVPAGPVMSVSASLTPTRQPSGPTTTLQVPGLAVSAGNHEDVLNVLAALKPFFDGGFTGTAVTFAAGAAMNTAATEKLDSIQLDLVYETTAFRIQNLAGSCVGASPYTGSGSPCALVKTTGQNSRFYVAGTTYAPLAALDITLNHITRQVFGYGLIARSIVVAITGSADFTAPVITVPEFTTTYTNTVPVHVFLQVYLCPATATCPTPPATAAPGAPPGGSWVRRLSARVDLSDPQNPRVAGSRDADLVTWNHIR